jgi:signal transduction histidine kinase
MHCLKQQTYEDTIVLSLHKSGNLNSTFLFLKKEEKEGFSDYIFGFEKTSLRWLSVVGCFFTLCFIIVDYFRVDNFLMASSIRIGQFSFYLAGMLVVLYAPLTTKRIQITNLILTSLAFISGFLLDWLGEEPGFFLINYLSLLLFIANAAFTYPFQFKLFQTAGVLVLFYFYSSYLSSIPEYHGPQITNIALNCSLSLLLGYMFDFNKYQNYRQHVKLLKANKKIAEVDMLKTKLISIFSHDLSSPLNNLRGLLELNEKNMLSAEELALYSKEVKQSLDGIISMQSNLLNWTHHQLDGFKSIKKNVNISALVGGVIKTTKYLSDAKNIEIENLVVKDLSFEIDVEIIKIVLRNFLTNAIKFSPFDGKVTISSYQTLNELTISVKDNGIGMTAEQVENLFLIGKKSNTGTNHEKGSGIGLIIAKDFADKINGKINVSSELGKGSEFSISFHVQPN